MKIKKILFVTLNDHVPWGGSEELWSKTAVFLSKRHKISVLIKKWNEPVKPVQNLLKEGVEVNYKLSKSSIKGRKTLLERLKSKYLKPSNEKRSHDLDVINQKNDFNTVVISLGNHVEKNLLYYTEYLIDKNINYVIIVQLATDLRVVNDKLVLQLKRAYENAQRVYFLSKENVFKTELLLGCKLLNKELVDNPFNYAQKYIEYNNNNNSFNFACVASLNSFHKSQDLLISVLGQAKWKKRNIHLNLYGSGVNKLQIERLISMYGINERVSLIGYESDKNKIWSENHCCIMPSKMEGQSLAMLEAMSCGRMIISTKVGDAERLILEGKTGFLIDFPSYKELDMAMEKAWCLRDNWRVMGENSRNHLYSLIKLDPVECFASKLLEI